MAPIFSMVGSSMTERKSGSTDLLTCLVNKSVLPDFLSVIELVVTVQVDGADLFHGGIVDDGEEIRQHRLVDLLGEQVGAAGFPLRHRTGSNRSSRWRRSFPWWDRR